MTALGDRAAQLLEAQRIAGVGSWEWTVGSEQVSWSEGLHLILKRDLGLGAPTFSTLHQSYTPESWKRLGIAIEHAIEDGTPYELELAMIRDDGEICWTTTRGEAVRGLDGGVVRLRGTVHDIHARRDAEAALQERETQLRAAQRIAGIGSWEWEVGSEQIQWSEGLQLLLGRGAPTFVELPGCYTHESWKRLGAAIAEAVEDGTPYELELAMLRADGEECTTTTRGEPVRGPDGAVCRLRGTVHDITERKRLQIRTAQADRLSSMGLLAAGVAHEVNNPLTYVLYNVQSLSRDLPKIFKTAELCVQALRDQLGREAAAAAMGPDAALLDPAGLEDALSRAQEAVEGSERIRVLIRSLSTFSRVEKVEESRVELRHAIESAVNMARNEMKFRARLVLELGNVPDVWASEGKLSQVFLNLLINAAHSIDEGDAEHNMIKIRTWAEHEHVYADVADTGRGIRGEDLERIFEPFFSSKKTATGSGLGLAICRNIVAAFGGEIWAESEGKGSRFTLRLPTTVGGTRRIKDGIPAVAPAAKGRILVVDDEPAIRSMLTRLLGSQHELVAAESGVAGKRVLQEDQGFDVILCDLMMPDMTGMELHEWLALTHPPLAERVVFITGGIFTRKAAQYLAGVSNPQVDKPFDLRALEKLMADLVEASPRRR